MNLSNTSKQAAAGGIIAAIYIVLSFISSSLGLCSGLIQLRLSEALCVLPIITPAAIPGLTIGCLVTNLLTSGNMLDVIFGSIATLLGAIGTYYFRKKPYLASLFPVISNALILPFVISKTMLETSSGNFLPSTDLANTNMLIIGLIIATEEFLSCFVLGNILRKAIEKYKNKVRK